VSDIGNTRAVVGDNRAPAYAQRVTDEMASEYAGLTAQITELLDKAREAPKEVDSDEAALSLGSIIKALRDAFTRADAYRTSEKEPHLRSAQAVDQFFFSWMEKCRRRNPRDRSEKPGAADILQARIDSFLEEKRIAEEAKRKREADEAARIAREAQEKADREAKEAEDARLAAERARKPETIEQKSEVAAQAEQQAATSSAEAELAASKAQDAHIATLAKPAELARTRGNDGVLLTLAKEDYAYLIDRSKLDPVKLFPYFTEKEIEKALRGWAKATSYSQPMDGAEIGRKNKGVTR
jgi:hypothetical protein